MGRLEWSIEINAPPEKVWEMLALDRFQEWQVGRLLDTKNMEFTSELHTPEDKYRVGASAHASAHPETKFEVTESRENERITYSVTEPNLNSSLTCILEPMDEGTKMTYAVDVEIQGFLMKIVAKLFQRMGEGEAKRSLEKLKAILEE